MPDRTGSAVIAAPAPSLTGSSPMTDTLSADDWPVSGAAVSGTAVYVVRHRRFWHRRFWRCR